MKFSCPNCNLAGSIDDAKLPEQGLYAGCPKCKTRFLVKKEPKPELPPEPPPPVRPQTGPRPDAQTDAGRNAGAGTTAEPARPQRPERPAMVRRPGNTSAASGCDMATFIGKNSDIYLRKFASFGTAGNGGFAATWHWPAFLVPFWWLIYRKQYLWAILAFVLSFIPTIGLLSMIVFGLTGNYIYYTYANKKLLEISALPSEMSRAVAMARAGGVNNLAWVLAPLIGIAVIGILAAIAIPQFNSYRQKAFHATTLTELRNAKTSVEDYYQTNRAYPETLEQTNFRKKDPKVDVRFRDRTSVSYTLVARHQNSDREFAVKSDSDTLLSRSKSAGGDFVPVAGTDGGSGPPR